MKHYIICRPGGGLRKYRILDNGLVQNLWRTEWTNCAYTLEELLEDGAVLTDEFYQINAIL